MIHLFRPILIVFFLAWPTRAVADPATPVGDPLCQAAPIQMAALPQSKAGLLEQILKMDEPDMQMRGRLGILALAPVQVMLQLDYFAGDPQRIVDLVSLWTQSPALKGMRLPLHHVRMEGVTAWMVGKGIDVRIQQVALPEGSLHDIHFQGDGGNRWELAAADGALPRMPEGIPGLPPLHHVKFSTLRASGNRHCPGRMGMPTLEVDGIQVSDPLLEVLDSTPGREVWQMWVGRIEAPVTSGRPSATADPLLFWLQEARGVLRQLTHAVGAEAPADDAPWVVEQGTLHVARHASQVDVTNLRLSVGNMQVQGRAKVVEQQPSGWVMDPDLLLTTDQTTQKAFKKRLRLGQSRSGH
ncbi:MAG: hypothetical protein HQL63_00630 [Magnetococcales bacterium]|nr:hypothetical protein [Magnetococcales bacterium]